jgi:hypothetical protein
MNFFHILQRLISAWGFTALLPLPMLLATSPARDTDVKCLYLGLTSAWFATEVFGRYNATIAGARWHDKVMAVLVALAINVSLFIALGLSVGVQSNVSFPLMAAFCAVPALGIVPWLMQRIEDRYAVIILGATIVAVAKLGACVVARVVYGPDYVEQGYVANNWHTAKLMISLFWGITVLISAALLWRSFRSPHRNDAEIGVKS